MFIHRLLYRSEAVLHGTNAEVDEQVSAIVEAARKANEAAGLTGALLLSSGVFIQALEGPVDAIERKFESICCDLRHRRVRLLQLAVADERIFGDWSMSRVTPTAELASLCPTLDASERTRLDATRAEGALQAMRALLVAEGLGASLPELVWPDARDGAG